MSSHEFTEWQAYAEIEPIGYERGDLQAGVIAATLANVHRDAEQTPDPYKPADFIHEFWPPDAADEEPRQSWQEQLALVEALNAAFGGKDLRGVHGDTEKTAGSAGPG